MRRTYFTLAGQPVSMAFSMQGANRGDYILDADMTPLQPRAVTEVNSRFGVWRRVTLSCMAADLYSTRTSEVDGWIRL